MVLADNSNNIVVIVFSMAISSNAFQTFVYKSSIFSLNPNIRYSNS